MCILCNKPVVNCQLNVDMLAGSENGCEPCCQPPWDTLCHFPIMHEKNCSMIKPLLSHLSWQFRADGSFWSNFCPQWSRDAHHISHRQWWLLGLCNGHACHFARQCATWSVRTSSGTPKWTLLGGGEEVLWIVGRPLCDCTRIRLVATSAWKLLCFSGFWTPSSLQSRR